MQHQGTAGSRATSLIALLAIALAFLAVALVNRLPVLFPDTMAYSSAGEAVLGVFAGHDRAARHAAPRGHPASTVSEARSPYYGVGLALVDRIGGVWLAAGIQALVAAAALVVALRRLDLNGRPGVATATLAIAGGLAFYSVVLLPDVFLGPVILALAFLPTDAAMPRREQLFWAVLLVVGLLFHRSFLAVSLALVVITAAAWRAPWFARRGWGIAATATLVAALGHAAVGPVVEHVYRAPVASPPFLLARMAEGRVLPAYLADACPATPYLMCGMRPRLPMDHQRFLWAAGADGAFNTLPLAGRRRIIAEAGAMVVGAVAARPLAAAAEALRYAGDQLVSAGMDDFTQRVPTRWRIDPALRPAMAVYPVTGIVSGTFGLHTVSHVTLAIYLAALATGAAAAIAAFRPAWFGRRAVATVDRRRVAAVAIIVAGIVVNAAVSGMLSGLQDRYAGRIAWLAPLAAAALLSEVLATTRTVTWRRHRGRPAAVALATRGA